MSSLKAATVSNPVAGKKRKKKIPERQQQQHPLPATTTEQQQHPLPDTTTEQQQQQQQHSLPTKTTDGGSKPRRPASNKPSLSRANSSVHVETSIPWPDAFRTLAKTHSALNLTYTFCSTRKHFATTLENLRSTVESSTKRPLLIEDVARVRTIIPHSIHFQYVDEAMLQVALMGEGDVRKGKDAKDIFRAHAAEERNVREGLAGGEEEGREVLFFEFVDGDLRREVVDNKTGEIVRPRKKIREEELKMPVFSQKQMVALIAKRNAKFTSAVNGWLNECAERGVDAVETLEKEHVQFVPVASSGREERRARGGDLPHTIPTQRKKIADIIEELKGLEWYTGQIVPDGHRVFDPQEAVYGELDFPLSQDLVNALYHTRSIQHLYSHQTEAINALHAGHNVIIATSTSSGKSLIYQLPVLHALETAPETRAMYIFPTKALAQDQRRSLQAILSSLPRLEEVLCETFDGDTPFAERNTIRDDARIIFTNPDMLHLTILPQEEKWRSFLRNLRYVVVDELHVYNGLFGSHVSFIMRRLRRICAAVGNNNVQFVSCSATVANPEQHFRTIFGIEDVKLVDFDGSPSGRKEFLCWNTPYKDPGDPTSGRGDSFAETARLFCQLVLRGVRVITFCRIRRYCEMLTTAIKAELTSLSRPEVMNRVMAYRGGYTPQDRRRIEKEMFEGKLVGIIGTSALELGVDIGSLDAVISHGFPYSVANLRQQSGRAGRRNQDSLSVLVGDCFPTDQYFMNNPDEIFTRPNCELQVDLTNMLCLEGHVQCAAHEMPITPDSDRLYFGKLLPSICEERLREDSLGFYHTADRFLPFPSRTVAIRDTEEDHFAIIDTTTHGANTVLEELEASRAFFTIYEGGIFLHQGHKYLVKTFSPEQMLAKVVRVHVDWITQQRDFTDIDPLETEAIRRLPRPSRSRAYFGTIKITQNVFGFFKLDQKKRILDAVEVDNPPVVMFSKGLWLDVPRAAVEILQGRRLDLAAGIHAAEHAVLSLMPNFVISMPGDVRTNCNKVAATAAVKEIPRQEEKSPFRHGEKQQQQQQQQQRRQRQRQRQRPAHLTFFDAKGGPSGSGIAAKAFEFIDMLLEQACERVESCHCRDGCLECCCGESCRDANLGMSDGSGSGSSGGGRKAGAEVILKSLLGRDIDVDGLPWGGDEGVFVEEEEQEEEEGLLLETVVLAEEEEEEEEEEEVRGRRVEVFGEDGRRVKVEV